MTEPASVATNSGPDGAGPDSGPPTTAETEADSRPRDRGQRAPSRGAHARQTSAPTVAA